MTDLSPLTDLPIQHLTINGTKVTALGCLLRMPLREIQMRGTPVADLSPLLHIAKLERVWSDAGHFNMAELRRHLGK